MKMSQLPPGGQARLQAPDAQGDDGHRRVGGGNCGRNAGEEAGKEDRRKDGGKENSREEDGGKNEKGNQEMTEVKVIGAVLPAARRHGSLHSADFV